MVAPNPTRRGSAEIYPPAEPSHFTFCASAFFGSQEITRESINCRGGFNREE